MTEIAALNIKVETSQVKAASKDLDALAKSGGQAETASDRLQKGMLGLAGAAKALAASYVALKVAEYVRDSAMLAARYETLGVVMTVVGKNAGYTAGQMESMAQGLQKTGISMNESRQTLTRMTQAQLDLTKSSQLARVAQDAAVIGNINSSEAFQRLVLGIQSGQVETLRTIGINVSFEKSYAKIAQELHKTVGSLTEQEKTQARMNAVMEAGKRIAGTYEGAMGTAGKQLNSLARYHEDLGVEIGKAFGPSTTFLVEKYTDALKGTLGIMERMNNHQFGWFGLKDVSPPAGNKAAMESAALSDKGRAEMLAAKRQDENAYQSAADERLARGPKERFAIAGARVGTVSASAALQNALAESGGNELNTELTRLAGERAAKIAQYRATMANPDILPGVAAAHTAQRAIEEKTYVEQVEQAKRKAALETDAFIGKLDAERTQRALDQKQAIYDAENEYKTLLANEARTIGGKNFQDQKDTAVYDFKRMQEYGLVKDTADANDWLAHKLADIDIKRLESSRKATDGMDAALLKYSEGATNAGDNMNRVFTNAFGGMEDALTTFATTGKMTFSSFASSVIADLVRMQIRMNITGPLAQGLQSGSLFSGIGSFFGFNHGGGMVGNPTFSRELSPLVFAGAPRFHSGGWPGLAPDEVPIIAQRGERVLSRDEVARGAGTQTATVYIKDSSGKPLAAPQQFDMTGMRNFVLNVVRDASDRGVSGFGGNT